MAFEPGYNEIMLSRDVAPEKLFTMPSLRSGAVSVFSMYRRREPGDGEIL